MSLSPGLALPVLSLHLRVHFQDHLFITSKLSFLLTSIHSANRGLKALKFALSFPLSFEQLSSVLFTYCIMNRLP